MYLLTDGDRNILYIGETRNLRQRFNDFRFGSYGFITPPACYKGGQSTNLRINKLVLKYFETGKPLRLYFTETADHKKIEKILLQHFITSYNIKYN
ncbi:MAG: GIY-YIG nuclease family protein [Synergistaceae bacterium]|nr:GIY-YIG nuclease family protein [Synergistaceae bacterium]